MSRHVVSTGLVRLALKLLAALAGGSLIQNGCGGGYYPDWGLYDPTGDIQDVIGYRQDVMDWSNYAWDQYIRGEDYVPYEDW